MNFNNSLELTQSQNIIITTQLKQSLKILNMSKLELEEDKQAEVGCQFCNSKYMYNEEELLNILKDM